MERIIVPTELFLEVLVRYEAQIRPRIGLEIKKGIAILNSLGKIDADYRREVCKRLVNLSDENFVIEDVDRICQMVISINEKAEGKKVDTLLDSERGSGGFGRTGNC